MASPSPSCASSKATSTPHTSNSPSPPRTSTSPISSFTTRATTTSVTKQLAMPFGAAGSVYAWDILAEGVFELLRHKFRLVLFRYVDDLFGGELEPRTPRRSRTPCPTRGRLSPRAHTLGQEDARARPHHARPRRLFSAASLGRCGLPRRRQARVLGANLERTIEDSSVLNRHDAQKAPAASPSAARRCGARRRARGYARSISPHKEAPC